MKKFLSLCLALALVLGVLTLAACGKTDSKSKEESSEAADKAAVTEAADSAADEPEPVSAGELNFKTISDLKASDTKYEFMKADHKLEDDHVVCEIKASASGDIVIPAKYHQKEVVVVTSESTTNDKVTSITVEKGVRYIENCLAEGSAFTALTLPDQFKGIYHSFNKSALAEVSLPKSVHFVVDAFNDCDQLKKLDTNGYVHGITDAFKNDAALADVTIGGSVQKIENSFTASGVKSVSFPDNIHDIFNSFNECPDLESVTCDQIAGGFYDSFCKCSALKEVNYKQGGEKISLSYNECNELEKVDFGPGVGDISGSFENCAKYTLPEKPAES